MKKSIVVTAALSLGLLGGVGATTTTANASKVHRGLPHSIINTKWHAKRTYISTRKHYETSKLHFHKTSIYGEWAGGVDPFGVSKLKYKYVGHHTYKLYGREYGNAPAGGYAWHGKVKVYSKHKIYFKNSSDPYKYSDVVYHR